MKLKSVIGIIVVCTFGQGQFVPREDTTEIQEELRTYQEFVDQILYNVTVRERFRVFDKLADFVEEFGNRPAGSESLENAFQFFIDMAKEDFQIDWDERTQSGANFVQDRWNRWSRSRLPQLRMYREPVKFRVWRRNTENASIEYPHDQKLNILGLGNSVPTPPEGISANILVVRSFQELRRLRQHAAGKIVVFNQEYQSYHSSVKYRVRGASQASRYGAVAALIRSITPESHQTPHTGDLTYDPDVEPIPAASITVEDAQMLNRMQDRHGNVTVKIFMGCEITAEEVESGNLVIEIVGKENPDEVVILGAHLDSWDVGLGAMDNAAGAIISYEAFKFIYRFSRPYARIPGPDVQSYPRYFRYGRSPTYGRSNVNVFPRRTIRLVLWTAHELGRHGAKVHFNNQTDKMGNISLVLELNNGAFRPRGLVFTGEARSARIMKEVTQLFGQINATNFREGRLGLGDTAAFRDADVAAAMMDFSQEDYDRYFTNHHTEADSMGALDGAELDMCMAMWAGLNAVVADMSETLI